MFYPFISFLPTMNAFSVQKTGHRFSRKFLRPHQTDRTFSSIEPPLPHYSISGSVCPGLGPWSAGTGSTHLCVLGTQESGWHRGGVCLD